MENISSTPKAGELPLDNEKLRRETIQRGYEDTLIELFGQPGWTKACTEIELCRQTSKMPSDRPTLYQDLEKLAELNGGSDTKEFRWDVSRINRKLDDDKVPLEIAGIRERDHRVLVRTNSGHLFTVIKEDGLVTIAPSMQAGHYRLSSRMPFQIEKNKRIFDPENISPFGVNQSGLADCYFLGPASALAASDPTLIPKMVRANTNGTFTVTFPGDPLHPQTIQKPNTAEVAWLTNGHPEGWINVLEKAHRKLKNKSLFDDTGYQDQALELLTGEPTSDMWFKQMVTDKGVERADAYTEKILKSAIAGKSPMVVASPHDDIETRNDGIQQAHTYAVLSYDEIRKTVRLRNPLGLNSDGLEKFPKAGPGVFDMPLRNFVKDFNYLTTLKKSIPDYCKDGTCIPSPSP